MKKHSIAGVNAGFTLVELLIVIALVVILVALLFPVAGKAIANAQTSKCVSNQKQIAIGLIAYASDNNGRLPPYVDTTSSGTVVWTEAVRPYLNLKEKQVPGYTVLRCPAAKKSVSTTVGVNYSEVPNKAPFGIEGTGYPGSMRLAQIRSSTILTADIENPSGHAWFLSPNQFPLTVDTDGDGIPDSRPGKPSSNWFAPRHGYAAVCSFADGSVKLVPLSSWARNENGMWGP